MKPGMNQNLFYVCMASATLLHSVSAHAEIAFEEVTESAGMVNNNSQSYGASWGDLNSDGLPDLWVLGHRESETRRIYLNKGNGQFEDVFDTYFDFVQADRHGAAWADFDNDGDQDLLQMGGGGSGGLFPASPNELFVNTSLGLVEESVFYGLDYPDGRGRTPLWFDWNGDGLLDVFLANTNRTDKQFPSAIFTQQFGTFVEDNAVTGISNTKSNEFAQMIRLTRRSYPALLIHGNNFPDRVYLTDTLPFRDVTARLGLPSISKTVDVAIADFNGDRLQDIFVARAVTSSDVSQPDEATISGRLVVDGDEKAISFSAVGNVSFRIGPAASVANTDIYIGGNGWNPADQEFVLNSDDSNVAGLIPHSSGSDFGLYIGFDTVTNLWQVVVSKDRWLNFNFSIVAHDGQISELATDGFVSTGDVASHRLFLQTSRGFRDATPAPADQLELPSNCSSVAAADMDNDMDIDLYLVCGGPLRVGQTTPVVNLPNVIYENLGNGEFQVLTNAGVAAGSLSGGAGDSVALADFDEDGFIDMFVTNGSGKGSAEKRGPDQLFRNLGNSAHWIEIDLVGVVSNRDGIGARVTVRAQKKNQVRDQNGGMHRYSQDYKRLHFGLGNARRIRKILIEWPSGIVQTLENVAVDQILEVVEPVVGR